MYYAWSDPEKIDAISSLPTWAALRLAGQVLRGSSTSPDLRLKARKALQSFNWYGELAKLNHASHGVFDEFCCLQENAKTPDEVRTLLLLRDDIESVRRALMSLSVGLNDLELAEAFDVLQQELGCDVLAVDDRARFRISSFRKILRGSVPPLALLDFAEHGVEDWWLQVIKEVLPS